MRVVTPRHIADQVQDWTVKDGNQTKGVSRLIASAVLDALWECNKRNQMYVYPSIDKIAERTGIRSRRTIARALTALEEQGLIRALGPRHGGRKQPTVWGLVDNDGNRAPSARFTDGKPGTQDRKPGTQCTETGHSVPNNRALSARARKRELEERKEERMKSEPPLRLVEPPEPPRTCRMPDCDHPAVVGSRCIRHAAGLPFPAPEPADGIPQRPERHEETA